MKSVSVEILMDMHFCYFFHEELFPLLLGYTWDHPHKHSVAALWPQEVDVE